jgi:hypothetical protein
MVVQAATAMPLCGRQFTYNQWFGATRSRFSRYRGHPTSSIDMQECGKLLILL